MILHQLKIKDINRRVTVSFATAHNDEYHVILHSRRLIDKKTRNIASNTIYLTLESFELLYSLSTDLINRNIKLSSILNGIRQNRTNKLIKKEYIK